MGKDFSIEQKAMIDKQIKARGIKDKKVIDSMLKVKREIFVSDREKSYSYKDGPLPIGYGQTISQPYIVAYMTEMLELNGNERVLEIGTGSGYQTAILAEIVDHIFTIEVIEELGEKAKVTLIDIMNYSNISFKIENGRNGWPEFSPFDRIIIAASTYKFPENLFDQLEEGGIAVAPVGDYIQRLMRYRKLKGKIVEESLIGVSFVPFV